MQYITGSPVTVGVNQTETATATCPAGTQVISGGFRTTEPPGGGGNPAGMTVFNSFFAASNDGWRVRATNKSNGPLTLTAFAVCAVVQ